MGGFSAEKLYGVFEDGLNLLLDLDPARPNEQSVLGELQTGALYEPDVAHLAEHPAR